MAKPVGCLDAAVLENYARGALPEAASEEVERHLLECETCYLNLRRHEPADVLIDTLRRSRTSSLMTNEAHAALVERVTIDVCRFKPALAAGSDDEPSLAFLAPAQQADELGRLGGYRILRQLGAGGMGMVFLAEDSVLHRRVALKTILPRWTNNSAAKERFLREARAAAAIEHENIIAIHQVGEEGGVPFLAMPFLQGVPLDSYLEARSPEALPVPEVCRIGQQIARGLGAAHARCLIHRDVKPGNIWLEGAGKKVKILDFGLARAEDDPIHVTKTGAIVGTPAYMAPEQGRSGPVDYRADLFSLGCILYEMSTGRRPFDGRDTMSILTSLALDDPRSPRILNTQIPAELSDLIVQLLAKDPTDRPQSADDVARRLQALEFGSADPVTHRTAPSGKRQPSRGPQRWLWIAVAFALPAYVVAALVLFPRNRPEDPGPVESAGPPVSAATFRLDPANIPADDVFPWQPRELVAVIGEHRARTEWKGGPITFSPDGTILACMDHGRPKFFDAATLKLKAALPSGRQIAYLPDNNSAVILSPQIGPALWDMRGTEPKMTTVLSRDNGSRVALSRDGKVLAIAHENGIIGLWNLGEKAPGARPGIEDLKGYDHAKTIALSADGKILALVNLRQTCQLWDLSGTAPKASCTLPEPVAESIFTPDGNTLITVVHGKLCSWDLTGVKPALNWSLPDCHGSLSPSADGKLLACEGEGFRGHLYDISGSKPAKKAAVTGYVLKVALSPDGKSLAACSAYGITLWNVGESPAKVQATYEGQRGSFNGLFFSGDGKTLAAASSLDEGELWDLTGVTPRQTGTFKMKYPIHSVTMSSDGNILAIGDGGNDLRILEIKDGRAEERFKEKLLAWPTNIAISSDARMVACAVNVNKKWTVKLWDLTADGLSPRAAIPGSMPAFSPDGTMLVCRTDEGDFLKMALWDIRLPQPRQADFLTSTEAFFRRPTVAVWAPDGKHVAVGSADRFGVWQVRGQSVTARFTAAERADVLAFSADHRTLAVADDAGSVHLWDVVSGKPTRSWQFPFHVSRVVFAPDARHLAIANSSGVIYVLRLAAP